MSHDLQLPELTSKYDNFGQNSTHRPFDKTGRLGGHVKQALADVGVEHVAQSG